MWDNSPRRGSIEKSVILHGSTPEHYERWLKAAISRAQKLPGERLLFVNAWNEWAEGTHLEPDLRHGRADPQATRRTLAAAG